MCYNAEQLKRKQVKYAKKVLTIPDDLITNNFFTVSGFTHPTLYAITTEKPNELSFLQWGLIPKWVKDEEQAKAIAKNTLNAKCETVFEKPSFKSVVEKRCLIPVDGFYEWQQVGKNKYPYFIYPSNNEQFIFGGLYEDWINKNTGEVIKSFSIITTAANSVMAKIHNIKKRMPLILGENEQEIWLNKFSKKEDLNAVMQPCADSWMHYHSISKLITSRKENNNNSKVIEPYIYPELT